MRVAPAAREAPGSALKCPMSVVPDPHELGYSFLGLSSSPTVAIPFVYRSQGPGRQKICIRRCIGMRCNWLYGCIYITYSARSLSQPHSVRYSIYSAYSVYAVYSHTAYTLYILIHSPSAPRAEAHTCEIHASVASVPRWPTQFACP